ncbi:hypothetical protein BY458DRAFT_510990 [Sporodiniella umbellata]|nr:hypothetical protein BY458DRAFT_510990 [Sporodiniella umbellata]
MHKRNNSIVNKRSNSIINLSHRKSKFSAKPVTIDVPKDTSSDWVNQHYMGSGQVQRRYKRKLDPFQVLDDHDDDFQKSKNAKREPAISSFILPNKRKPKMMEKDDKKQVNCLLQSVEEIKREVGKKSQAEQCPFCGETLEPLTEILRRQLDRLKRKDQEHREQQKEKQKHEDALSSFSRPLDLIVHKRQVSDVDQHTFCKLHCRELVLKPLGQRRGYPESIDFDSIERRMESLEEQVEDVIYGRIQSQFKKTVMATYEEVGIGKARNALYAMHRVDQSIPGYYGPRGAAVISQVLSKKYLYTHLLTQEITQPLLPIEYIQQVLVPEIGIRLIRQDLLTKHTKEKQRGVLDFTRRIPPNITQLAEETMAESKDYGAAMFPMLQEETITLLSDNEE